MQWHALIRVALPIVCVDCCFSEGTERLRVDCCSTIRGLVYRPVSACLLLPRQTFMSEAVNRIESSPEHKSHFSNCGFHLIYPKLTH
jgi:hypothetical protein